MAFDVNNMPVYARGQVSFSDPLLFKMFCSLYPRLDHPSLKNLKKIHMEADGKIEAASIHSNGKFNVYFNKDGEKPAPVEKIGLDFNNLVSHFYKYPGCENA